MAFAIRFTWSMLLVAEAANGFAAPARTRYVISMRREPPVSNVNLASSSRVPAFGEEAPVAAATLAFETPADFSGESSDGLAEKDSEFMQMAMDMAKVEYVTK